MRFKYAIAASLLCVATACGDSPSPASPTSASPARLACTVMLSPRAQSATQTGGAFAATLTMTETGCGWTATTDAPWIAITGGASGSATGTIAYMVSPNSGAARTGSIQFALSGASISLPITQDGQ